MLVKGAALLFITLIASGCNQTTDESSFTEYDGNTLSIAVIGDSPANDFEQVSFQEEEPNVLTEEHAYDAFMVTEAYFEELSQSEWTSVFASMETPIFFAGIETQEFVFTEDSITYEESPFTTAEHISGFVSAPDDEEEFKTWGYSSTESEGEDGPPEWSYHAMFKDIEAFRDRQFEG
ncbi:hypothetical protein [Salsuginibacillus kocurii]|uniref:hypothetical protein n=1 Tax=Salsuginibacillus kocurii TaxID=427078 RepID=UPI0003753B13|nr:hypothetical protein [Salsuginibacillus kocurii]